MTAQPLQAPAGQLVKPAQALQVAHQLCAAGRMTEARAICDAILAQGANAAALQLLGVMAHQQGNLTEAIELLRRAAALAPQDFELRSNLGVMLQQAREFAGAEKFLVECALAQADEPTHHFKLGNLRRDQGRYADAIQCYARALRLAPTHRQALNNIVITLWEDGQPEKAVAYAELASELFSGDAAALVLLAEAYRHAGRGGDCERTLVRARNAGAEAMGVALNLWGPYIARGAYRQAVLLLESALAEASAPIARQAVAFSTLLFTLNYMSDVAAGEVVRRHREWGARFAQPVCVDHANDPAPERKLRIGYVSADFRSHSVANFLLPVLDAHDRDRFEVYCYSNTARPDSITQRIAAASQVWRPITGLDDASAERLIRDDRIDVLVDLGGHSADNRLMLFARKPAPVQISWLGYPNTTGLAAMDYRISDEICDPEAEYGAGGAETVLRLPDGFHCYAPLTGAPEAPPPPCTARGHITFGSFNTIVKLSDATLQGWSAILDRLPDARLVIKNNGRIDDETMRAQRRRMAACGMNPARVSFLPFEKGPLDHLARYGEIDIALDPFPYNGTTTTCEALWMGVPVVTLRGDRHAARVGASLLSHIGRPEWIGRTLDEYVRIAVALAADRPALGALRRDLRGTVQASPICDRESFARALEGAFRAAWRGWCNRQPTR